VIAATVIAVLAQAAAADQLLERPEIPVKRCSLTVQVTENLEGFSDDVGFHLGRLSSDLFQLGFDVHDRSAKVRLGGDGEQFSLRIDSDILIRNGAAEVDAEVDVRLLGRHLHVDVPRFEVVPRSHLGERHVELRVPILRTEF